MNGRMGKKLNAGFAKETSRKVREIGGWLCREQRAADDDAHFLFHRAAVAGRTGP